MGSAWDSLARGEEGKRMIERIDKMAIECEKSFLTDSDDNL